MTDYFLVGFTVIFGVEILFRMLGSANWAQFWKYSHILFYDSFILIMTAL